MSAHTINPYPMKKLIADNKKNPWFWLFIALAALLLFLMPLMSRDAGNSGDEDKFQIPQGRYVMDYYQSDGQDTTCLQDRINFNGKEIGWNLKYYGCSFDVVTEWVNRTFDIEDIAKTRHACNALLGWIIVLFGGLIAFRMGGRRLGKEEPRWGGWRAGVITMLLLFLSPRLLGHSFNNPKDIPLAAGVIMCIYYMMMFFRQVTPIAVAESGKGKKTTSTVTYADSCFGEKTMLVMQVILLIVSGIILFTTAGLFIGVLVVALECLAIWSFKNTPHFNPLTLLMLALSLALAVSTRIGGLIVVGYMGLWGLLWLIGNGKTVGGKTVAKTLCVAVATCAVGFFGGLLLWPYAMQDPIGNSMESFRLMSQFDVQLRQLFEGKMVMSSQLPWYYTPKFILMTVPVAVLIGWVLYLPFGFGKERRTDSVMIYFTFLFPVIWIVITGANVYGGWRHSLFAYPPMAVAAGLGFDALAAWAGSKSKKRLAEALVAAVPFLLMVPPALHTVRNHPYEYVYFNELSGGVKKAFGHYELDYYYHSMREATEWVVAHAEPKPDGSKTLIGSWHLESTQYFMRKDTAQFATRFVRWGQRYEYEWDYLVFPITGISGDYLLSDRFPPKDCVHTVEVDGVPIALVLKRQTLDDYYALQQLKAGNADSAVTLFHRALAVLPENNSALTNLANIYLQSQRPDSAIVYCQRLLGLDADDPQGNQMLAMSYLQSGRTQEALQLLDQQKAKGVNAFAFSMSASLKAQQGDLNGAVNDILAMLDHGLMDQNAMQLYMQIRQSQGTDQNSALFNFYNAYANGLEKNGDKNGADQVRKQLGIQ